MYYSLPTAQLANDHLQLDYLLHAGPRIVRLIPRQTGRNLLAETPDATLASPYGPLHLWGGHRLWHAPESRQRTYVPDDGGLSATALPGVPSGLGVLLTNDEPHTGIRKEIAVRLADNAPRVELRHQLTNLGLWPVELAPWAITELPGGGTVVLPTPPGDPDALLPSRLVALWPYSRWDDPRLRLEAATIEIDAQPMARPFKIGIFNSVGWMEYRYQGVVFRKRWTPQPQQPHADLGCNAEVYTYNNYLEMETLGPLVRLGVGETVEHVEEWEIEV